MSVVVRRRTITLSLAVGIAHLVLLPFSLQTAHAQTAAGDSSVVEVAIDELTKIQQELAYLRERDAQRQAWEASLIQRLPVVGFDVASHRRVSAGSDEQQVQASDACDVADCDCTKATAAEACCGCCRCFPCECPLPEAPCIECPHVSTLSPNYNLHLYGAFVGDMLFNEARPISPGAPYYLSPASPTGRDQNTLDLHGRSSYLAANLTGPQMGVFQAGGQAMVFFYNDNVLADQYGILPVQIWGDLRNDAWRFAAGLQFDVFNPISPTMLAFSVLCGAGNAGNAWRGQVRVERFLIPNEDVQWTIQAALSEPIASVIDPGFRLLSEDNGWPNVEGRVALGLGPLDPAVATRPLELGVSGIVGQVRSTPAAANRVVADVWGAGIDLRWELTECVGLMGEVYTGKTLGTYNGAILQNVNTATFEGIRSSGGWGEVYFYWTPCLHSHIGYGVDDPDNDDLSTNPTDFQRERNETIFGNVIWDANQSFRIGFELTYRDTDNTSQLDNDGVGFHTQFRWSF